MTLEELCRQLDLEIRAGRVWLSTEVTGGYASDLLSCVMAGAQAGNVWVTMQGHPNIVAVASLLNLSGIIVTEGAEIDPATLRRAEEQRIPILSTPLTTFTVVGRLFALGVLGADQNAVHDTARS